MKDNSNLFQTDIYNPNVQQDLQKAGSTVQQGLRIAGPVVKQGLQSAGDTLQKGFHSAAPVVKRGLQSAGDTLQKGFHSAAPVFQRGLHSAEDAVQKGFQSAKPIFQKGAAAIEDGFVSAKAELRSGFQKAKANMKWETLSDTGHKVFDVAKSAYHTKFVQGIIQGVVNFYTDEGPPTPNDIEDCVGCLWILRQVESMVGYSQSETIIYDALQNAMLQASEAPIFFPVATMIQDIQDDVLMGYAEGLTSNQICEEARLCRDRLKGK